MKKEFHVVCHKESGQFLSVYEDGEGTEYFCMKDFDHVNEDCLFGSKELAERWLKEARVLAGFSARCLVIEDAPLILHESEVFPILVEFIV